jgi:general nucleoside transport system ATP-binding protein
MADNLDGHFDVSAQTTPLVRVDNVTKRFGTFTANDSINLELHNGEIHALLGENGAGKSTLVKTLYGLLKPTSGQIYWNNSPITLENPEQARALGIGMVFQHFSLFDNLTVADNIALVLSRSVKLSDVPTMITDVSQRYGIKLEPNRPVWSLSAGERQRIEIVRCLLQDPKLLILDEPTSVLTPQEADQLFITLERLKSEGRALLYISHKLDEVKRLCDRATILRLGKVVGTCIPSEESARSMANLMVGTQISDIRPSSHRKIGGIRLAVENLTMMSPELHGTDLKDVHFFVRSGEIFGIAGIAGNGQSELFAVLSGETLAEYNEAISFDDHPSGKLGVNSRRRLNVAFVPEERNGHAAAPDFSLSDNVILTAHADGKVVQHGLLQPDAAKVISADIINRFDVRKSGIDPAAKTLSGGNLQKFVVGREILRNPDILIVNQPTWGVDAAAAAAIRQALIDLAGQGAALVIISQDLDELFEISDRLAVINHGTLSEAKSVQSTTREEIGLLMAANSPVKFGSELEGRANAH